MKKLVVALLLALAPAPLAAQGVVASADPRASEAGREMLAAGGSAADAALAMMLALTVVEPQSSGFGGGGFFLHHDAETRLLSSIDGREAAPAAARPDRFMGVDGKPMPFRDGWMSGRSVGVPGNIRLAAMAHRKWGKLEWSALFAPAIRLAEQGFAVTAPLAGAAAGLAPAWKDFPAIGALYAPGGTAVREGDTVRNPELAALLKRIAAEGPDAFYTGGNAEALVAAINGSRGAPGDMTTADLAVYEAKARPPVCGRYRSYKICGMGPPSSGATTVIQILGQLERFDMKAMGAGSPQAWVLLGESMRLAYADREKYLGDPDFVSVPVAGLIDPGYIARRSQLIARGDVATAWSAGTPPGAQPRTAAVQNEVAGTTHFVAIDAEGDMVSMTSTVESAFGSQVVANGLVLNNELTDFTFAPERDGAAVANRVEPGKRPLSSMSPTIVYDGEDQPILAVGSAGGKRIIMHVAKTLVGVLDWGLPVGDALALPNLYFDRAGLMIEDNDAGRALAPGMAAIGATRTADLGSKLTALQRTPSGWVGAADPRSVGTALTQ
ncbi:gamma-glutamyltransferase [Sphingomonas baiyangensis]|uniref:Glutathione hydrolase proenzyme n=1 Tax=Sphingomonas baiyangensis TaxID=2572576 RepID=A0A4U1L9S6_9SPHN|nr:gamma-glutamyltransferase [Sphingomonas baiyangensis]TKD53086.1 gamma-glutamyltransferase [Sphingomonas baiyangensis]